MTIFEALQPMKKKDLQDFAEVLGYPRTELERVVKASLIDLIIYRLKHVEFMAAFILMLPHESLELLNRCRKEIVSVDDTDYIIMSLLGMFIAYLDNDNNLKIMSDFEPIFEEIYSEEYQNFHKKANWVIACSSFANNFYGIYEFDDLYEVVKADPNINISTYEEFELFAEELNEFFGTTRFKEYFISPEAMEFGIEELEELQENKPFYVPTLEELKSFIYKNIIFNEYYQELFAEISELTDEDFAIYFVKELYEMVSCGATEEDLETDLIQEFDELFTDYPELAEKIFKAVEHTHMLIHRGNSISSLKNETIKTSIVN